MANIPDAENPIEKLLEFNKFQEPLRPYLGYSQVGHHCLRYLWYQLHWAFPNMLEPRIKRLFGRGDQEEYVVVKDLRDAGMKVWHCLEDQIEVVGGMGHLKGHPDGKVLGVPGAEEIPHLLEIKTANDKKFREFYRFGVERTSPTYWAQIQSYMQKTGMDWTLYIITNKNNDARIYDRIPYVKKAADDAEDRGIEVLMSAAPPPRISESPEWYECKMCSAYEICHHAARPEKNCRTCENSIIALDGNWECSRWPGKPVPVDFQREGCPDGYRPLI